MGTSGRVRCALIATQQPVPKLHAIAALKRVRSRPILPQRVEHDRADCLACLPRQGARELRGFGVADMNLNPSRMFPMRGVLRAAIWYKCTAAPNAAATEWPVRDESNRLWHPPRELSNRFATALSGVDLDNPATVRGRSSGTVVVPRIVGPIRRLHPVETRDVEFLRRHTDHTIKITLPGPFTMSRQAKNEYYKDEAELVMDYAAAVNAEVRDLKAAGADVIQLDEPWLHARPEEARRLAPAGDRPGPRRHPRADRAAPLLRLCLCRPRQAERLFVPARAHGLEGRADLDRSRPAQSRSHNPRRPRRQDRDQHGRPRAGDAADRRRPHPRGPRAPAPRAADPRPGLQHEIHPARPRLRQIEGARRRCRDRPSRADRRLACRNGPIVFDLGPNDGRSVR